MSQGEPTSSTDVQGATGLLAGMIGDDLELGEDQQEGEEPEPTEDEESAPADDPEPEEEYEVESDEDEESEDDVEEPEPEPTTFRVKVDGEEVEVTLDELQRGYSRQSDYTRKTQQVASERKALEEQAASIRAQREQYEQRLNMLEQALTATVPQEPDWEKLYSEDPAKFVKVKADWDHKQQQLQAVQQEKARTQQQAAEEAQRSYQAHLSAEAERLAQAVPEWKDESVAKTEKQRMVEYAGELGYTPDELAQVADHRAILLLRKAMKYDELTTKGKEAVRGKVAKAPVKPLQPGAPAGKKPSKDPAAAARKRLRQTGRVDDAKAALEYLLGDD